MFTTAASCSPLVSIKSFLASLKCAGLIARLSSRSDARILKEAGGDFDCCLERCQLLLPDCDAPRVVIHHGHAVDNLGEGLEDDTLVAVDGL